MSDDPLLRSLAQVKREEQDAEMASLDERWDRLSAGELSPEEEAELRALAETSEDARQAYEAFRPLGPEFQAQVVRAVQAQNLAPEARREVDATPEKSPGQRRPLPRRASRWAGWSAVAAAAALVLLLRAPDTQAPLPGYAVELTGGVQEMRGDPASPPRTFPPGSPFDLVVRPQTAVSGPLEARYFLSRDGALQPWDAPGEITEEGVVRVAGTVGEEIAIPPGEWTLLIVVGRPGRLPDAAALSTHLARPPPGKPDWALLKTQLRAD